jgi:hypothetical protein
MWDTSRHPFNPNDNVLYANLSNAESVGSSYKIDVTATGFQIKHSGTDINASGGTYIYMAFKGSYSDYVSDYNTDGTIDSRVKANPAYGFSITSFVGNGTLNATVGHGLSSAPEMVLVKNRSTAVGWLAWHKDLSGATYRMDLNGSGAEYNDGNGALQGVSSSLITLGSLNAVNQNSANMICYAFHSVAGYSSIGSYTGNGSSNGPFVNLGFRPAYVLTKRVDTTGEWWITDSTRYTYNGGPVPSLWTQSSGAEASSTAYGVDFLDNGFKITTTYGDKNTNGGTYLYIAFADTREAAFWKDVSGQGNHWTPNNLDYRDSLPDSPANNFATFNPLLSIQSTFSEGNLKTVTPSNAGNSASTIAMSEGKWYAEFVATSSGTVGQAVGVVKAEGYLYSSNMYEGTNKGIAYYSGNGQEYDSTSGSLAASGYGSTWTTGDVIGVAYDADNSQITFYKNGVSQGLVTLNAAIDTAYFSCGEGQASATTTFVANFGQDSTFAGTKPMGAFTDDNDIGNFQYAPPAGYLALCTANLPTPTIVDGSDAFNTVLYTGNGSTQSITGVGFQPDFTWIKSRNVAYYHRIMDSVRGISNALYTNSTDSEGAFSAFDGLTSFDADGFTSDSKIGTNENGTTYAAWNWKAGGTAVSNTDGSITSQVSANVDAGFSIVSYTGTGANATVGHGLAAAPEMMIVKNRNDPDVWLVYHDGLASDPQTDYIILNRTDAKADLNIAWNDTAPTSNVFSIGSLADVNRNGKNLIAYCFHSVDGFSKAGSYTGNGSSDGPFVYTGHRVAWVMIKKSSGTDGWSIYDSAREPINVMDTRLSANLSDAEVSGSNIALDFLSNGFKLKGTGTTINTSGATYIYLAFAENPFKYSNAR